MYTCVYIYIYIHIHIYIYIERERYMCTFIYIYIYIYTHILTGTCVNNRGARFHRIRDFKLCYFNSIPPTFHYYGFNTY